MKDKNEIRFIDWHTDPELLTPVERFCQTPWYWVVLLLVWGAAATLAFFAVKP